MIPIQTFQSGFIIVVVVVGAIILFALAAGVVSLFRLAVGSREPDPTLLEQVNAARPPRTWFGTTDRSFDRIVRGTQFGWTTDHAMEWILLGGAIGATGAYLGTLSWITAVAGLLVGGALVMLTLYIFRHRWKHAIQDQLPDACFQLARCMRAGLSLPASILETSRYIGDPVASIFRKGAGWMDGGLAIPQAMRNLADDVQLTDFDALAEVVSIQADYGGNLPTMLDRLAVTIRDRNQFRGYYRSVTSLSRISAIFIALSAPVAAIALWILQPELFNNFFTSNLGIWMLVAAGILELVGIVWILWLISGRDEL